MAFYPNLNGCKRRSLFEWKGLNDADIKCESLRNGVTAVPHENFNGNMNACEDIIITIHALYSTNICVCSRINFLIYLLIHTCRKQ